MAVLSNYTANTIVIKEARIPRQINLFIVNKVIDEWLKSRGELDNRATLGRAKRVTHEIIIIGGYGSLTGDALLEVVSTILDELNVQFIIIDFESFKGRTSFEEYRKFLPRVNIRTGAQCGGVTPDTDSIDKGVEELVNAINKYPGITTFSSCEGHIKKGSGTLYVLFTAADIRSLSTIAYNLDVSLQTTIKKHGINMNNTEIQLLFDYGHWPNIQSAYFELRVRYPSDTQEMIFGAIADLSNMLRNKL